MADSKLKVRGLARGREGSNQERAVILAGYRRQLSMTAAKAYSACVLDRVSSVGESHRQAAKRRAWVKKEEGRMEEESRDYWHAYVRSWGKSRGQFAFRICKGSKVKQNIIQRIDLQINFQL